MKILKNFLITGLMASSLIGFTPVDSQSSELANTGSLPPVAIEENSLNDVLMKYEEFKVLLGDLKPIIDSIPNKDQLSKDELSELLGYVILQMAYEVYVASKVVSIKSVKGMTNEDKLAIVKAVCDTFFRYQIKNVQKKFVEDKSFSSKYLQKIAAAKKEVVEYCLIVLADESAINSTFMGLQKFSLDSIQKLVDNSLKKSNEPSDSRGVAVLDKRVMPVNLPSDVSMKQDAPKQGRVAVNVNTLEYLRAFLTSQNGEKLNLKDNTSYIVVIKSGQMSRKAILCVFKVRGFSAQESELAALRLAISEAKNSEVQEVIDNCKKFNFNPKYEKYFRLVAKKFTEMNNANSKQQKQLPQAS